MRFSTSLMCPCVYSPLALSSVFRGLVFSSLPAFRPVVFSSLCNCSVEDPCYLLVSFRFRSVRIYRSYSSIPCATGSSCICRRTRQTSMLNSNGENHASKRVTSLFRFFFNSVLHDAFSRKRNRQTVFFDHSTHRSVQCIRRGGGGNRADPADCNRRYRAYSDGVTYTSPASGQR